MTVLISCENRAALPMAISVASSLYDQSIVIYSGYFDARLNPPRNARFTSEVDDLFLHLSNFDALITFACSSHPACRVSLLLSLAFQKLGKPRFNIQHGLLEEGIVANLSPYSTPETIYTDHLIRWDEFGVPLPLARRRHPSKRILVTSNLHWDIYSESERSRFKTCIVSLAERFPSHKVVLRPHPAEYFQFNRTSPKFDSQGIEVLPNVHVCQFSEISAQGVDDFLSHGTALFSSPSGTLLDAQRLSLPCVVFKARRLQQYLDGFRGTFVSTPEECVAAFVRIIEEEFPSPFDAGFPISFKDSEFRAFFLSKLDEQLVTVPAIPIEVGLHYLALAKK